MTRALVRHAAFFAAGLLATAAQALLLRELVVDAAGDEAAIGVGLAAWLAGIALGAALARRSRARRAAPSDARRRRSLALLAVLPPLAIVVGRLLRGAARAGRRRAAGRRPRPWCSRWRRCCRRRAAGRLARSRRSPRRGRAAAPSRP